MLEETLESPLDCKEIQPVHPKGDQSWMFIGRTDAEAEAPILWSPVAKSWLIGKDPDARKDWRQEEKGTTERDGWMASLTQWRWVWVNSGSWWWTGKPGMLQSMVAAVHGITKSRTQLIKHNWSTELNLSSFLPWEKHCLWYTKLWHINTTLLWSKEKEKTKVKSESENGSDSVEWG